MRMVYYKRAVSRFHFPVNSEMDLALNYYKHAHLLNNNSMKFIAIDKVLT